MKHFKAKAGLVLFSLVPLAAMAEEPTYDVSDAVSAITDGNAAIAVIGGAALFMVVGIKVWRRLRGAA